MVSTRTKHICTALTVFITLCAQICIGQTKTEREVRVKKDVVPKEARNWIKDAYEGARKISWFEESSETGKSFEAKLKWKDYRHSVKFDTLGRIVDIEVETDLKELPPNIHHTISKCLDSAFVKHNIRKVQIQYTGESDDLEDLIDEDEYENLNTKYEIEFFGKTEDENELWEGLFDQTGQLIKCRIIKISPTDNLHY